LSEIHKRLLALRANLAHANESLRPVTAIVVTPSSTPAPVAASSSSSSSGGGGRNGTPSATPSPSASPRLLPTSHTPPPPGLGLSVSIPPTVSLPSGTSSGRTPSSSPGGLPAGALTIVTAGSNNSSNQTVSPPSSSSSTTVTVTPNFGAALACHMYVTVAAQLATGFSEFLSSQVAELTRGDMSRGEEAYQRQLHRLFHQIDIPADGNCLFASIGMGEVVRTALSALSSALPTTPLARSSSGGSGATPTAASSASGASPASPGASSPNNNNASLVIGEATWILQAERLRSMPVTSLRTITADTRRRAVDGIGRNMDRYIPLIEREVLYALEESHHDATSVAIRTRFVATFADLFTATPAAKGDTRILVAVRSRAAAQIYADVMAQDRIYGLLFRPVPIPLVIPFNLL
jgi:hypothetical protein